MPARTSQENKNAGGVFNHLFASGANGELDSSDECISQELQRLKNQLEEYEMEDDEFNRDLGSNSGSLLLDAPHKQPKPHSDIASLGFSLRSSKRRKHDKKKRSRRPAFGMSDYGPRKDKKCASVLNVGGDSISQRSSRARKTMTDIKKSHSGYSPFPSHLSEHGSTNMKNDQRSPALQKRSNMQAIDSPVLIKATSLLNEKQAKIFDFSSGFNGKDSQMRSKSNLSALN